MSAMLRMFLIYPHLIACCIALGSMFMTDLRLLQRRGKLRAEDARLVQQTAQLVSVALAVLWISGLALIYVDFGHVPAWNEVLSKPKLCAKILVVLTLSLNGLALHRLALPRLISGPPLALLRSRDLGVICITGGISACSWFLAAFLGIAKPLAQTWNLPHFISLYALALGSGMVGGLLFALAILDRREEHATTGFAADFQPTILVLPTHEQREAA